MSETLLKLPIARDIFRGIKSGLGALDYSAGEKAVGGARMAKIIAKKKMLLAQHTSAIKIAQAEVSKAFLSAQQAVTQTEMMGHSWLQTNWRPIAMMVLLALIVFDILIPDGIIPEDKVEYIYNLFQIGLGGYVVGRSAIKAVKAYEDKTENS